MVSIPVYGVVLLLLCLLFNFLARAKLKRLTNLHIQEIEWVEKGAGVDLLDAAATMFFAYVLGMSSSKITAEDKKKLTPLVGEVERTIELLSPYFVLTAYANFCFWSGFLIMMFGLIVPVAYFSQFLS